VNSPLPHRLLLTVCLISTAGLIAAADPKAAIPTATDPVLALPTMEVTAQRVKKIDKDIKRLDKMIAREKKKVKSTDLDRTLNNAQVSRAAALFGGNSAEYLSAVAATRVTLLETERDVLETMKRPATLEELALMEAEIEQLRLTRRNLDNVQR
jgi:hypothetical protein